ncbi:MAG: right-handed parallel beta-helix repeat-containing protein [Gammaproteobacteria bacterium]|nr:right-handed parallel beta-helix repeat-containing protein [Gammaproteobacteria bacterium]
MRKMSYCTNELPELIDYGLTPCAPKCIHIGWIRYLIGFIIPSFRKYKSFKVKNRKFNKNIYFGKSGTISKPIYYTEHIEKNEDEQLIIDVNNSENNCLVIEGDYIIFENYTFSNATRYCVEVLSKKRVLFIHCDFTGGGIGGLYSENNNTICLGCNFINNKVYGVKGNIVLIKCNFKENGIRDVCRNLQDNVIMIDCQTQEEYNNDKNLLTFSYIDMPKEMEKEYGIEIVGRYKNEEAVNAE